MSVTAYTVIAIAILFASCLQASIGFGMGMLAAPVVALVDPSLIPGTLIMLASLVTLMVVIRERTAIDVRGTGWALVGRVPGTVAGALLLGAMPERALALAIAGVVLAGVLVTSLGWAPTPRRRNLVLAGATSGVLGTATSIGGPPMALVYQSATGPTIRATLSTFFVMGTVLSIAALAVAGRFGGEEVVASLALVPGLLAGFVLSRRTRGLIDRGSARVAVLGLSTASALALLAQQLLPLVLA